MSAINEYLEVQADPSDALSSTGSSPSFASRASFSSNASSFLPDEPIVGQANTSSSSRRSGKTVSSFITKLFSLVDDVRFQALVSWNPAGTSFLIRNVKKFAQIVLPEYFKHGNFSSFVRLLNMYGFHKVNKSARGQRGSEHEIWEFFHPQFRRGQPELLKDIKRKAMDSELLKRETGDYHQVFSMLQLSQTDLQRQFQALQTSFSNLLQGFEDTRKMQLQQQIMLRQIAERQGIDIKDMGGLAWPQQEPQQQSQRQFTPQEQSQPWMAAPMPQQQPNVTQSSNQPFIQLQQTPSSRQQQQSPQQRQQQQQQQQQQQPNVYVTDPNNAHDPWNDPDDWDMQTQQQPHPSQSPLFNMAINTPLPPSPVPNVFVSKPTDQFSQSIYNTEGSANGNNTLGLQFAADGF
ncbi:hypothetical protein BCR43DRAFT_38230 [Syncephalastrum racemosum]|uniref:HSF-type DNA-binding domain-containing protein n=1 Tax=Syncephalastrum racemosum TaxID=13706 RepID=A0A1X2HUC6_SYNRA|nr:hypothetical protein BCR43DRAFT_38230 [Syncephalastrum racemosum]